MERAKRPADGDNHQQTFFARLPAGTYRHLRVLAGLPSVAFAGDRKSLLLRFEPDVYERLRNLAVRRPWLQKRGAVTSMQAVIVALVEARYVAMRRSSEARCKRPRTSMAKYVAGLIRSAQLRSSPQQPARRAQ